MYWDQGQVLMKYMGGFIGGILGTIFLLCPCVVFAAAWNDPGVNLQQNSAGRWYDQNTGQYVSTAGMAVPTGNKTGAGNTGTTVKTATATENLTGAGNKTPKKLTAGKVAKGAGAALGVAAGAVGIYESTKGNTEHSVGNVLGGAASGALAGASVGSVVVPGIGTAVGAGIGAVVGGLISGSQLFSETDCLTDPVTDDFTCCHTVFNKGERQANIGDYMFCGDEQGRHILGAVRQCITPDISKTKKKVSWGLDNDAWSPECELRWCSGETPPASGQDEYIKPDPDMINFCWRWGCIDGFVRSGDLCVSDIDGTLPVDQYETVINKINALRQQIISTCGAI